MTMVAMVKYETKYTTDLPLMGQGQRTPFDLWHSMLHRHDSTATRPIGALTRLTTQSRNHRKHCIMPQQSLAAVESSPLLSNEADYRDRTLYGGM